MAREFVFVGLEGSLEVNFGFLVKREIYQSVTYAKDRGCKTGEEGPNPFLKHYQFKQWGYLMSYTVH